MCLCHSQLKKPAKTLKNGYFEAYGIILVLTGLLMVCKTNGRVWKPWRFSLSMAFFIKNKYRNVFAFWTPIVRASNKAIRRQSFAKLVLCLDAFVIEINAASKRCPKQPILHQDRPLCSTHPAQHSLFSVVSRRPLWGCTTESGALFLDLSVCLGRGYQWAFGALLIISANRSFKQE